LFNKIPGKRKITIMTNLWETAIKNGNYTYKLSLQRAKKLNALPSYLNTPDNLKRILQIYVQAAYRNLTTKKRYHVDHILPLQGANICGLHSPQNLRIITKSANENKSRNFSNQL
jgi:hypothetical protein